MSVCEEEEMRTVGCIFSHYTISDVYSVKTIVKLYSLSYILIPAKCLCLWLRKLHRKKKPTAVRIVSHRFVTVLFISNKIQHFFKKYFMFLWSLPQDFHQISCSEGTRAHFEPTPLSSVIPCDQMTKYYPLQVM